jgi:hypothetical protein
VTLTVILTAKDPAVLEGEDACGHDHQGGGTLGNPDPENARRV